MGLKPRAKLTYLFAWCGLCGAAELLTVTAGHELDRTCPNESCEGHGRSVRLIPRELHDLIDQVASWSEPRDELDTSEHLRELAWQWALWVSVVRGAATNEESE